MTSEPSPRTVVSLFSGAGGLDLGLEAAGFETLYASDIDSHSCRTLAMGKSAAGERGLPFLQRAIVEEADVRDTSGTEILKRIGLERGELDVLAGGPPCQAFSVMGRRQGRLDPRGQLPGDYARVLAEMAPRVFVFENVYGLLTIEGGAVFEDICELLSHPGQGLDYTLSVFRLNAADYGVPQKRDRVIVVGSRDGHILKDIPRVTSFAGPADLPVRTVEDALRDLPPVGQLPNHVGRVHSERIMDRYAQLAFGERDTKTRINRLNPLKPSYAIVVGSDAGGGKGHVHPYEPREVTPRESARIQTFPDWWEFSGTTRHPIRQVGNAVPPLLGACIGKSINEGLLQGSSPSFHEMSVLLGQTHLFDRVTTG